MKKRTVGEEPWDCTTLATFEGMFQLSQGSCVLHFVGSKRLSTDY